MSWLIAILSTLGAIFFAHWFWKLFIFRGLKKYAKRRTIAQSQTDTSSNSNEIDSYKQNHVKVSLDENLGDVTSTTLTAQGPKTFGLVDEFGGDDMDSSIEHNNLTDNNSYTLSGVASSRWNVAGSMRYLNSPFRLVSKTSDPEPVVIDASITRDGEAVPYEISPILASRIQSDYVSHEEYLATNTLMPSTFTFKAAFPLFRYVLNGDRRLPFEKLCWYSLV